MMIGELAKKSGVGIETIRYYEREGLVFPIGRKRSGYRTYDGEALSKLQFIKRSKELGFSLREIGELLSLNSNKKSRCKTVKGKAQTKVAEIQAKIDDLSRMKSVLNQLIETCHSEAPSSECPILEALQGEQNE